MFEPHEIAYHAYLVAQVTNHTTTFIEWKMAISKVNHYIVIYWATRDKPKKCYYQKKSIKAVLDKLTGENRPRPKTTRKSPARV